MKYFTPELYGRFNSPDPDEANRADKEWDAAQDRYEKHLKQIRRRLPEKVRVLCDKLCLHDAAYRGLANSPLAPLPWQLAIIRVQQADKLYFLLYVLLVEPEIKRPVVSKIFSKEQPRWLYDEVDLGKSGAFCHEILISNGLVLRLVFEQFDFFEITMKERSKEPKLAKVS